MGVLKMIFQVPRPELFERLQAVTPGSYSFPSGHALRATGMFGFLAAVLVAGGPRRVWRWLAAAGCVLVAAAVCWSRVYIGVHWPTDVAAGAAAAAAWVTACMMARHYAKTRPPRTGPIPADARGGNPGRRVG
jgi:diacylglycerol kinase (ATP)